MEPVFRPLETEDTEHLWEAAAKDADWPVRPRTRGAFFRLVEGLQSASTLGEACLEAVEVDGRLAGFCVLQPVPMSHLGPLAEEGTVVEGGTYLTPWARGRGLNAQIKERLLAAAWVRFAAAWCVFLVPCDNRRALAAFARLPWPHQVESARDNGRFAALLRRREWEEGHPLAAVAFSRDSLSQAAGYALFRRPKSRSSGPAKW
ncbi:GNAT family N-acetyltransferase [Alicyclobacillus shizuokensis]|uniref:GNAT family N-acetyltransferase n=1 Tax=Alicyclobacillus shizuokensis TaxID=392014 RepID=UPI0012ED0372|nr:GNAT family protein [Alicyclobacillus shizuokensis]